MLSHLININVITLNRLFGVHCNEIFPFCIRRYFWNIYNVFFSWVIRTNSKTHFSGQVNGVPAGEAIRVEGGQSLASQDRHLGACSALKRDFNGLIAAVSSLILLISLSHSGFLVGNWGRARLRYFYVVREEIWSSLINNGTDSPKWKANPLSAASLIKKKILHFSWLLIVMEAWCILCIFREGTRQ